MKGASVHLISDFDPCDIQKGIPIPPRRSGPVSKYRSQMQRLEIGDSFFVPKGSRQSAVEYAKEYGITITTRTMGRGLRIWRTA